METNETMTPEDVERGASLVMETIGFANVPEGKTDLARAILSRLATAAARVPGLEAERRAILEEMATLESERDAARQEVAVLRSDLDLHKTIREEQGKRIHDLRAKVAELEQERAVDVEMLAERGRAIDSLKARATAAEKRAAELDFKVQHMSLTTKDAQHAASHARAVTRLVFAKRDDVWFWQGDGSDHPESMVNDLPVVMSAATLRGILAEKPTPAPVEVCSDCDGKGFVGDGERCPSCDGGGLPCYSRPASPPTPAPELREAVGPIIDELRRYEIALASDRKSGTLNINLLLSDARRLRAAYDAATGGAR